MMRLSRKLHADVTKHYRTVILVRVGGLVIEPKVAKKNLNVN